MRLALVSLLVPLLLGGCNLLYKPEVQQGTPLTTEALAALKPGMTKRQVRLLLGSPSIADVFHPDRWDYLHTASLAGEPAAAPPHLTLFFKNDALAAASGALAPPTLPRPDDNAPAPKP